METKDVVLLVLAILGVVVAVRGAVLDSRRRAQEKWTEQQTVDRFDPLNEYEAAKGDPEAVRRKEQRAAKHLLATGKPMNEEEPSPTRSEIFRAERGQPYWLTIGGVALSAVSGIVGALWDSLAEFLK